MQTLDSNVHCKSSSIYTVLILSILSEPPIFGIQDPKISRHFGLAINNDEANATVST